MFSYIMFIVFVCFVHVILFRSKPKNTPARCACSEKVSVDAKTYKCSIEEFHWDSLWWKCLDTWHEHEHLNHTAYEYCILGIILLMLYRVV